MADNEETPVVGSVVQLNNTPEPPPAATTVVTGTKSERECQLEKELETERAARKKAECQAGEWQDQFIQLRETQIRQPAPSAPKRGFRLPNVIISSRDE